MPLRLCLLAAVLLLAAAACSGPRNAQPDDAEASMPEVALEEPFELRLGETALLAEDSAFVRFDAVERDNRCPLGVTCVRAGEATARFTLRAPGVPERSFVLTLPGLIHGEAADLERYAFGMASPYAFALLLLEPYPGADEEGPATATLLMRRLVR